jgi:hypothetical protein
VVLGELGNIDVTGNDADGGVASPHGHVEGCIVGPDEAGTGYQAESALGERLRQAGPGNGVDAPPPIGFEEKPNGEREL